MCGLSWYTVIYNVTMIGESDVNLNCQILLLTERIYSDNALHFHDLTVLGFFCS